MKPAEALAERIIEGVEAGARMVYREDQSVRTHDFDLHRIGGRVAAVEVTSITDGVVKATYAANRQVPSNPEKPFARGTGAFTQRRTPSSSPSAEHGDAYLARIEADGIEQFFAPRMLR
jgi:hypothetical protein